MARLADADSVPYPNDTNLRDDFSSKSAAIAAKKISQKYKKVRSKTQSVPINLSDIDDADTVDYNDDTNLKAANMDKNAILTANKISDKYITIRRRRKRAKSLEPIEGEWKRPKASSSLSSKS